MPPTPTIQNSGDKRVPRPLGGGGLLERRYSIMIISFIVKFLVKCCFVMISCL